MAWYVAKKVRLLGRGHFSSERLYSTTFAAFRVYACGTSISMPLHNFWFLPAFTGHEERTAQLDYDFSVPYFAHLKFLSYLLSISAIADVTAAFQEHVNTITFTWSQYPESWLKQMCG